MNFSGWVGSSESFGFGEKQKITPKEEEKDVVNLDQFGW